MTRAVTLERWSEAQHAEGPYWNAVCTDGAELARVLAEKVSFTQWAAEHLHDPLPEGDFVEIGIGPLGVGCIHLLPRMEGRALFGVDPLALRDERQMLLPSPLAAVVTACHAGPYTHLQRTGESTGLDSARFALAACYNVLDHVRDPAAVLAEISRILVPHGCLLLGCDTVSTLSRLRYELWVKRLHAGSIGVRAHPFRFGLAQLLALLDEAGLRVLHRNGPSFPRLQSAAGHAYRLSLVCESVGADEVNGMTSP